MLKLLSSLKGFGIDASDGSIGSVRDFLFEDRNWRVRWLVIDTGGWLSDRKVLVHPAALGNPDFGRGSFSTALSKAQVRNSPNIRQDQPVSRQMEDSLYSYSGYDPMWGGNYFGGMPNSMALPLGSPAFFGGPAPPLGAATPGDPHLRSAAEVKGYHLEATDGNIGHVEDFLLDDDGWGIRYLVIDTRNWWPGKEVLMSPYDVRGIDWSDRHIRIASTRAHIQNSPAWDRSVLTDDVYLRALHSYYGWPAYGG